MKQPGIAKVLPIFFGVPERGGGGREESGEWKRVGRMGSCKGGNRVGWDIIRLG